MIFDDLRLTDLLQIKKALSTECEILTLYIEKPTTLEIVSSISVLSMHGVSPATQRDVIQAEITHCKKLIQLLDLYIKDLTK